MAYTSYSLKYNGVIVYTDRVEGDVVTVTYNGATHALNAGSVKLLDCGHKVMRTNLVIGRKTLTCAGMVMRGNLTIETYSQYAHDYDVILNNKIWTVPRGVRSIEAFLVGGGGGGGGCSQYDNTTTLYGHGGGGGGGGYVTRATLTDFIAGETTYNCVIGAGGAGGTLYVVRETASSTTRYGTDGGNGGATYFGSLVADGGRGGAGAVTIEAGSEYGAHGGAGGSGGGGGAGYTGASGSSTYYDDYGGNGGTNGGNGSYGYNKYNPPSSPTRYTNYNGAYGGEGGGISTTFLGVTYAAGGGGGGVGYDRDASPSNVYAEGHPGADGAHSDGFGVRGCGGTGGGSNARTGNTQKTGLPGNPGIIILKLNY